MVTQSMNKFVLCIDDGDYEASLILGKVYPVIPDPRAAKDDLVRIFDESGEDYLYHKDRFLFVDFPTEISKKILALAGVSDSIFRLGQEPIDNDVSDASVEHDRYIYRK